MNLRVPTSLLFIILIFYFTSSHAQSPFPSLSPPGSITQVVGNTTIKVEYERPSVRERKIFGGLVPWDQVWRTGAGKCTRISFDKPVKVSGQSVAASTYALYTIPNPEEWVVILNTDTALYGSYDHDPSKDIVQFKVKPKSIDRHYETFTIDIDIIPNNAKLFISWANTQIAFDVQTTTDEKVLNFIAKELMTDKVKDAYQYAHAADYLNFHNTNLEDAAILADKSIAIEWSGWASRVKMEVYEKLEQYKNALEAAKQALAFTQKNARGLEPQQLEQAIKDWQKNIERLQPKE